MHAWSQFLSLRTFSLQMLVPKCFTFILEGCQVVGLSTYTSFLQHCLNLHTSLHITSLVTVGLMFALTRKVLQINPGYLEELLKTQIACIVFT